MMVSQFITTNQLETLSCQQKRQLEREYQKKLHSLQRQIRNFNLPVSFDNFSVTVFGNFSLLEAFKQVIDFRGILVKFTLNVIITANILILICWTQSLMLYHWACCVFRI